MSLMGTFGYYFVIKSFLSIDKTIAAPINSSYSMIAVLMGIFLLKEKDYLLKKIITSIIVFAGVVIIALS